MPGMTNYKQPDVEKTQWVMLNFSELYPADHPINKHLRIIGELDLRAVETEWTERCIAHNLGKLVGFARA